MEPKQTTRRTALSGKALAICTLASLPVTQLHAAGFGNITVGEIFMYVSIIVVVIGVAWFFASRQTDKIDKEHRDELTHHPPKKHYDHPNDPHFRKLRKKTS